MCGGQAAGALASAGLPAPAAGPAGLFKPLGVIEDAAGNLVLCDERDNRIRVSAGP